MLQDRVSTLQEFVHGDFSFLWQAPVVTCQLPGFTTQQVLGMAQALKKLASQSGRKIGKKNEHLAREETKFGNDHG